MAKSTKQLARELGLLRKRQLTGSPTKQIKKRQLSNGQIFAYLIVLDFESTCWENDKYSPQEIIEFPAVLLNTKSGLIESEFHYYLHPTERPILSDFCKQLTGIKQDMVDNGIPLYNCLRKFTGWLNKLKEERGILCADDKTSQGGDNVAVFVTWSDWDLGVCLHYEAKRKQILKPSVLNRWIDLRLTYKNFYARKPDGLSGALKDLGILFEGREHSGLDDARNTAALAWRMICDGCVMTITKTVKMTLHATSSEINTSNSDASHLKIRNNVSTNAQFSTCHIHHDNLSENNVIFRLEECLSKKKILSDSTNIFNSEIKSVPNKLARPSLTQSCNSEVKMHKPSSKSNLEVKKIHQPSSKIPVLHDRNKNHPFKPIIAETVIKKTFSLPFQSTNSSTDKLCCCSANISGATSSVKSELSPQISHELLVPHHHRVSLPIHLTNSSKDKLSSSSTNFVGASTSTSSFKIGPFQQNLHESFRPCQLFEINKNVNTDQTTIVKKSLLSRLTTEAKKVTLLNASNFLTPCGPGKINSVQSAFKTPRAINSNMKKTPPLCSCGRRSKRKLVNNQGPNHGRWFFSCSVSNFNDRAKVGCKFFQWELPCVSLPSPSIT